LGSLRRTSKPRIAEVLGLEMENFSGKNRRDSLGLKWKFATFGRNP
jgi:hypothetical protein